MVCEKCRGQSCNNTGTTVILDDEHHEYLIVLNNKDYDLIGWLGAGVVTPQVNIPCLS